MRKLLLVLLVSLFSATSFAGEPGDAESLLTKIKMNLTAEQWVATKSALVTIGINAGVSDSALATIQDEVIKKLNQLSNQGEWHIVSFDRSLDQSGLEKVQISAQARIPSSGLPNIRDKAKALSKPGETFTLDNVQFIPSEDELRAANTQLRMNIYQQTKEELDRINKEYPDQKYYVHEVNFIAIPVMMPVQPMYMNAMVARDTGSTHGTVAVGDKLTVNATVVIAATPDLALTKLLH